MRYNEEDAILPSGHLFCMLGGRPRISVHSSAGRMASCKANNTQDATGCAVHPRATQQTNQKRLQMHSMTMLAPVTEKQDRECDPARCQCRRVCETTLDTLTMSKLWEGHGRSSHETGRPARWRRDVGRGPPLLDESRSAASCRKQC